MGSLTTMAFLILYSCRDSYEPEVSLQNLNYLVVEGYIETGGLESVITLSRTVPLPNTGETPSESGATLRLSSSTGEMWPFQEAEPGKYILQSNFDPNQTYQLEIVLKDGNQYVSEALKPIITPEIDELGYYRDDFGVEIFISTKGNNEAQYFLWEYEEHWIFRPGVISFLKYENGGVRHRGPDERIDLCWKANIFPKIVLQNAARFENNTILQRELVRIPNLSEKLTQRYSIKVKQRAIDQAAYDFWEVMRKNSDDIGGIFSPLPSFLRSNMQASDPSSLPIIGHINMGESHSKRIYINHSEVEPWRVLIPEYANCRVVIDTIRPVSVPVVFSSGIMVPAREVWEGMAFVGYFAATKECTDCTLRGSNKAPDFWED